MSYRHAMPFGAELLAGGGVRFTLWAPGAEEVELLLHSNGSLVQSRMTAKPGGWFEVSHADAGAGLHYGFRIDGTIDVPDPASRYQPAGVHGPSEVIDPTAFAWKTRDWRGRPWEEAVLYELHVGAFSLRGDFCGVQARLDHLADLGITAIELMPIAAFPGTRNWGYDGVDLFAPAHCYGQPDDLKQLIDAAHERSLMVFLDVVYNHFGPDGNYLPRYAPAFFTDRHRTPWGTAINFDGPDSGPVREFYIHNALYWLEEYRFDGLRLDAVHAIADDSPRHILDELAERVRAGPGRDRHVHLVLENDDNEARYLKHGAATPKPTTAPSPNPVGGYDAQWNDDFHHALHVLLTGETDGYYGDYADHPVQRIGRSLAEGFVYQGESSPHRSGGPRGTPSSHLPPTAFVSFLQNHDQVGNRAFGERIHELADADALRAATAILLLSPCPPLLFMGQEFCADSPFLYFCNFDGGLAEAVTEGRRKEFSRFERFAEPSARTSIPDPNDPATFARSVLQWSTADYTDHAAHAAFIQRLLAVRHRYIMPRLSGIAGGTGRYTTHGETGLTVQWRLGDGSTLALLANLGAERIAVDDMSAPGSLLHAVPETVEQALPTGEMPPWSVVFFLDQSDT